MSQNDENEPPASPADTPQPLDPLSPPIDLAETDLPCRNCSFNLRGLSPESNCPECGTPIWRSIRGDELIYAGADYLSSLARVPRRPRPRS